MAYAFIKGVLVPAVSVVIPLWGVYRYFLEGLHRPRIEFEVEVIFFPNQKEGDDFPAEIQIIAHNKGKVHFTFHEINLRVLGLKRGEQLNYWREQRLNFPVRLVGKKNVPVNIIPSRYGYFFVEAGVREIFTFVTKIPQEIGLIDVFVSFKYRNRKVYIKKRKSTVNKGQDGTKHPENTRDSIKSFPLMGNTLYRLKRTWNSRWRHEKHTCERVFEVPEMMDS